MEKRKIGNNKMHLFYFNKINSCNLYFLHFSSFQVTFLVISKCFFFFFFSGEALALACAPSYFFQVLSSALIRRQEHLFFFCAPYGPTDKNFSFFFNNSLGSHAKVLKVKVRGIALCFAAAFFLLFFFRFLVNFFFKNFIFFCQ